MNVKAHTSHPGLGTHYTHHYATVKTEIVPRLISLDLCYKVSDSDLEKFSQYTKCAKLPTIQLFQNCIYHKHV